MTMSEREARGRLAYDASIRALDRQQHVLEDIRSRTGILLAAASLSASFLGARALGDSGFAILSVLALIALVTTLVAGVLVLLPREELVFSLSGTSLHRDLRGVAEIGEQYRFVAYWLDEYWERNEPPITRLNRYFQLAAGSLVAQIVLWVAAIGGTLG